MTENERIANAFTEIFDNYFCLYERKDVESLPHDVQLHIADLYYRRPYDESDDGTYEMSEELDREIFKAININDFKKTIKADELQENGVEITEINTRKSIGEDFAFGDPGFSDEDIQESFDECIRSISFRNSNGESATFTSYTELKKALDNPDDTFFHKSVEKTPVRNFSDAGAKKLREMEENSDVYVDFLKFQGRVFKHSARVALEFFAQRPDTKFIATQGQWEHSGRQIAQGSEAIRFANPDGKTVDLYDFSQVEESKPPQQWAINKKNAPEIKKRLGIPENYPLISGVINTTLTPSDITSCMNALKIPPKDFRTFQKAYINAVQIIASGRLEVGGNKFNIKPDTSVLKMLKTESQKLAFLSHVASSAKNVLMKIENVAMTAKFVAKSERDEQAEKEKVELVNITEAISKKKADIVKMVEEDNFSGATESIKEVENLLKRAEELRKSIRKKPITQDDIQTLRSIQPPRKSVQNLLEKEVAQTTKFESLMSEHMGARSPYEMRKNGDNQPNDAEKRVPVIQLGEHEIPSNLSEIRKKEVLSEIKRGTFENTDIGAKIDFGKKSIDEIISKAMQDKKRGNSVTARICALYDMQEIIKNAVCFDSLISEYNSETSKNKSPNSMFMHNMYAVANHNGNFYLIGLEIEESYVTDRNDNFKGTSSRLYSLRDTEITPVEANRIFSPTVGKNNFITEDTSTGVTSISISQLYELVKSLDENFHENLQSPGRAEREAELLANAEYLDAVQTVQTGRKVTENADRQSEKIKQNRNTKDEQAKTVSTKPKKKYSKDGDIIIGNTLFRYIPKKTYTKIEQDILEDVTKKLEESGMKFSGVIKRDGVTLTTSETDKAKLDSIIEEVRSATKNNSVTEQQTEKEKVATNGNSDTNENTPETSDNSETNEQSESNSAEKVATYGNSDTNENTPRTSENSEKDEQSESNSAEKVATNGNSDTTENAPETSDNSETNEQSELNSAEKVATNGNSDTNENTPKTSDNNETNEQPESESTEKVATYGNSDNNENAPEISDDSETNEQSELNFAKKVATNGNSDTQYLYSGRFTKLSEEDKQFIDAFPETFISEPIDTPWGKTQQCHEIAKGVFEVSTAGHGGVMIREELAEHMLSPEALEIGFVEGGYHCYEEDADAQIPLRELFDKDIVDIQQYVSERYVKSYEEIGEWLNTVINETNSLYHPDYWAAHESAKDKLNAEMTTSENSEKTEQSESDSAKKEKVATNGNSDVPEKNFQHENVEIVERPARPTITCEWSESPFFEEGKTYSVAEFDKIMSDADRQKVEGYKKHMEVYGNEDLWLESDKDSYYNFIGYDKVKFNINLPDGRTVTERQDIGDGYGGVIGFLRSFEKNSNYNKIADILEDDVKKYPLESAEEIQDNAEPEIFKEGERPETEQKNTAPTVSDSEVNDKIIEEELPETEEISDDKNPELREVLNRFSAKHGLGELNVEPSNYTWQLKEKFSDGTDFLLGELRNSEYGMPFTPDELSKSLENFEKQIQAKGQNIAEIYSRESFAKNHGGVSKLPKVPDSLPEIRYAEKPYEKISGNIAAIREMLRLEKAEENGETLYDKRSNQYNSKQASEHRLRQYCGWGGLPQIFDERFKQYEYQRAELKKILTPEEYQSARASTTDAHYTPQIIIDAMYKAVQNMDLPRNARILEPSCGTGNFISRLPHKFSDAEVVGVEIDSVTARIAKQLNRENDNVKIVTSGFEETDFRNNSFDLAIGNVPFGEQNLHDPDYKQDWKIHDSFFRKALDKVAPGGVVAFVTSSGTMDKNNPKIREYLAERAELVGAVRLPNNAFSEAGTGVTADIIFLKKREKPLQPDAPKPDWCYTTPNSDGLKINSYFVKNPQMVLGTMERTTFHDRLTCKPFENSDLEKLLNDAIKNLNAKITVTK